MVNYNWEDRFDSLDLFNREYEQDFKIGWNMSSRDRDTILVVDKGKSGVQVFCYSESPEEVMAGFKTAMELPIHDNY